MRVAVRSRVRVVAAGTEVVGAPQRESGFRRADPAWTRETDS